MNKRSKQHLLVFVNKAKAVMKCLLGPPFHRVCTFHEITCKEEKKIRAKPNLYVMIVCSVFLGVFIISLFLFFLL